MSTQKLNNLRTTNAGDVFLTGDVFITAAGAITANAATTPTCTFAKNGFTVVKNAAAGRYDVTFYRSFKRTKSRQANMEGPASTAFPTTTGASPRFRAPASAAARQSSAIVQFIREDTQADADAASGTVLSLCFVMSTQ
jgi:hypothetical protein